jgi:hypothetical protein
MKDQKKRGCPFYMISAQSLLLLNSVIPCQHMRGRFTGGGAVRNMQAAKCWHHKHTNVHAVSASEVLYTWFAFGCLLLSLM